MTNQMTKGVLVARALALAIALLGVTVGPGGVGVAGATASRRPTVRDVSVSGGETLAQASRCADRGTGAWDDDSGDGGDGGDGGDDDGDD